MEIMPSASTRDDHSLVVASWTPLLPRTPGTAAWRHGSGGEEADLDPDSAGGAVAGRVVEQAARLATIEGLEGLSIGRLAEVAGLPKSSVHALFGSKEKLQLATISAARDSFIAEIVAPALGSAEPGREGLLGLCEGYLSYVERRVFPGGCFFVAASAEVGAQAGGWGSSWPEPTSSASSTTTTTRSAAPEPPSAPA